MEGEMDGENSRVKILMLPWLAYGHISPFVELAKKLSKKNFDIYICSTPSNLTSIKNKIPESYSISIQLVELHLPSLPDLPSHHHTTNGLPIHLQPVLTKALHMAKPALSDILKNLQPDLIIYDTLILWAAGFAFSHNIPAVSFLTSAASMCAYYVHFLMNPPGVEYPFPAISLTGFEHDMVHGFIDSLKTDNKEGDNQDDEVPRDEASHTMLVRSSRIIEGKYMDYLSQLMMRRVVPVGPLFLNSIGTGDPEEEKCEVMEWLGEKDELSTVYLSFGSEYFLNKEEMEEIAYGLEHSNVNFIWVVRFPIGEENTRVEEVLPQGFLERVGRRGKIVEKWAPQAKILGHASIGGFVSHCGWSSLMESIEFGVPIIAMPMHLDQPLNAKLVVELGVGVEVKRDEKGSFKGEEIENVLRDVVLGKLGESLREKVREHRESLRAVEKEEINESLHNFVERVRVTSTD